MADDRNKWAYCPRCGAKLLPGVAHGHDEDAEAVRPPETLDPTAQPWTRTGWAYLESQLGRWVPQRPFRTATERQRRIWLLWHIWQGWVTDYPGYRDPRMHVNHRPGAIDGETLATTLHGLELDAAGVPLTFVPPAEPPAPADSNPYGNPWDGDR